jgi:hypothetical protein
MSKKPFASFTMVGDVEWFELRREHQLTATEQVVLWTLVMNASLRNGRRFSGSITNLQDDMGGSRRAIAKAITSLEEKGLLAIVEPFVGGGHSPGVVDVACWSRIVKPAKNESFALNDSNGGAEAVALNDASGPGLALSSRPTRAPYAPNDARDPHDSGANGGSLIGIEVCRDRYDPDDPERPFCEQRSVRDCVAARLGKLSEYDRSDVLEHHGLFCVEEILSSEFVTDETVDRIAARLGLEEVSHG